jgi:DNA modification methylase
MIDLRLGDCLEVMKEIPSKSIDAIITDPPYGTTACKWDSVIDFDLMWEQLNRIIKPNGAIVLFGSEPFSSALRMSNIKNYKYDWVFKKTIPSNPLLAKKQILK